MPAFPFLSLTISSLLLWPSFSSGSWGEGGRKGSMEASQVMGMGECEAGDALWWER